eukprot:2338490-Prymnesium_polylepis.1
MSSPVSSANEDSGPIEPHPLDCPMLLPSPHAQYRLWLDKLSSLTSALSVQQRDMVERPQTTRTH